MFPMNTSTASSFRTLGPLVATVSVSFVVTQLDVTIVNVALANMGSDLNANVSALQWIVDSYTLAFSSLMLSAGVLGDRFGARKLFAAGMAVFALASLACGLAPDTPTLILGRAMQGVGAAAMLPNSLALLNQACRHDRALRAKAVGLWTAAGAVSIAAGPVVGGLLISSLGWRSIFFVNLPVCVAGVIATFVWIPRPAASDAPTAKTARPGIDPAGQVLAIVALVAFTAAIIEYQPLGLAHPFVAGGFVLAVVSLIALLAVEKRVASPMLPLPLFRNRTFSASVLFGVCVNLTYYGTVFVLSLFLQRVRGYSPLHAGLAFLPLTGGFLISNVASGWVNEKYGARLTMIAGAVIAGSGYALLHFIDTATPLAFMLLPFLLIPSGMGLAVPAMTTTVLASVAPERAGTASAILNTARQAGGAAGVAAYGALAAGAGSEAIVQGLHTSTVVSVCLLVAALLLARVHEGHARQHRK